MKRLIKKSDALNLRGLGFSLNKDIVQQSIQESYPNYHEMFQYKNANALSLYGMLSDDFKYIAEFYVFLDVKDEKWLVIVIAPTEKVKNSDISSNDLQIYCKHIEEISLAEAKQYLGSINIKTDDGKQPVFSEEAVNNYKNIG